MALTQQRLSFCFLFLLLLVETTMTDATTKPDVNTAISSTTASVNSTTAANTTATSGPTTVASTSAPGVNTTDPTTTPVNNTTAANTTATSGPTTVASTFAPGGNTTDPTTTPGGNTITTTAIATSAPGLCTPSPCPSNSICQELLNNYTCLCGPGLFYNEEQKSCNLAKTFLTDLKLTGNFDVEMANNKSEIFKDTVNKVLGELKNTAFQNKTGYLGSTVLSLKKGSVVAVVENFFTVSSDVTEETVTEALQTAAINSEGILRGAVITYKDICTTGFCDVSSTTCVSKNGLASCSCKEGYIKITATQQACIPCPSGKKAGNLDQCVECSFGYSGFNCEESYLLILVVVACVLGTLLLGTLTGAMVLYSRSKKMTKSSENTPKNASLEFTKPDGIPRIPRANPNSGWQPSNLEMTDSGSRSALVMRNQPETSDMWDYNYPVDTRSYKNQTPSRTGYGAAGATNGSRATRNPYYDEYDDKMRRY